MLEPPEEYYEVVVSSAIAVDDPEAASHSMSSKDDDNNIGQVSLMPSVTSVEWPDVNDAQNEESRIPLLARIFRYPSLPSQPIAVNMLEGGGASPRSNGPCIAEPRVLRKMRVVAEKTPIQHMLQPPIIASLLAIVVGSFPNTSSLLFGDDAPLAWITDSLTILGAALIPSVMLGLGSTLSEGPGQHSNLGLRTMVGISFTRLVVLPPLGIGVVHLAAKLGVLPASHDKMYLFVLLLQHSMPTSILAGGMTRLRDFAEHEASALLFWQHVFAVVPIAIYIMLYLQIVSTYI
jgi:predicted permease